MSIYLVCDMRGGHIKAFLNEEDARKFILKQPGKFNLYDIEEVEVE